MTEKKNILFIHGASSSPLSFSYIKQNLPKHNGLDFAYDSNEDLEDIIARLVLLLEMAPKELYIVAHSLGGVIATNASYHEVIEVLKIKLKLVTISSPFGGSKAATYLRFLFPGYGLFGNVSTTNPAILEIQHQGAKWPTMNIISTAGDSPLLKEPNDGVISVSSQVSLKNCQQKIHRINHFETLLSDEIIKDIKGYIWV
jgi:pimeloyl-ACP methyl ester carboxylesterase